LWRGFVDYYFYLERLFGALFSGERWKRHPFAGGTKAKDTADSATAAL
jgi:hypothetical protein